MLVQASDGNLYGTTLSTLFTMTLGGTLTTLQSFGSRGGLVQATDGNFYGTTPGGGRDDGGTVFKITPGGTLTTLHSFAGHPGGEGAGPHAGLVHAGDGNFYGTTVFGGTGYYPYLGTVFKITADGTLTTLYSFCSQRNCTDGYAPEAGLMQGTDGNFYGTTADGGVYGDFGTVFRLTPPAQLIPTTTVLMTAPNPSDLGEAVTMTATVTAQDGSIPTGTVVFESNGVQIGSAWLNGSGVAVLVYAGLSAGTDSLTAVYQGSGTLAEQHLQHSDAGGAAGLHSNRVD